MRGRLNVSRETFERLERYVDLLAQWSPKINLVSKASLAEVWVRHIEDSIQVYRCAPAARTWVDLGSGGGFPGLVVAILVAQDAPDCTVHLVESDQRKCAFLRTVLRDLGVPAKVHARRIEDVPPLSADVLSARALAPLSRLLQYAALHLAPSGTAVFPKGETWRAELLAAQEEWKFDVERRTSITDDRAVILKITGVSRD